MRERDRKRMIYVQTERRRLRSKKAVEQPTHAAEGVHLGEHGAPYVSLAVRGVRGERGVREVSRASRFSFFRAELWRIACETQQ